MCNITYCHKIAHIFTMTFFVFRYQKNKKRITQLENIFLTTSTCADRESLDDAVENYWKNQVRFVILDAVIINLKKRFSDESL